MSSLTPSTVHACPLCESWQIDYAYEAMTDWDFYDDFVDELDRVVKDHFQECLRRLVRG